MPSPELYVAAWSLFSLASLAASMWRREHCELYDRTYWRFLARPWKLVTFALAWVGIVGVVPYAGDPTWDAIDASFMAVLTFATAPWSVGVIVRVSRGQKPVWHLCVAASLWMLSASWLYDAYNWWRFGFYPPTWASNIAASSILYLSAGLFWSLEWRTGRGLTFAFLEPTWFDSNAAGGFRRIWWLAGLMMLGVAALFLLFPLVNS